MVSRIVKSRDEVVAELEAEALPGCEIARQLEWLGPTALLRLDGDTIQFKRGTVWRDAELLSHAFSAAPDLLSRAVHAWGVAVLCDW